MKGELREPGIMHWPGKIQTGVVSSEPCASMDIAPTILDAAGVNLSDHYLDGKSLIKLANGKDSNSDRVIFGNTWIKLLLEKVSGSLCTKR